MDEKAQAKRLAKLEIVSCLTWQQRPCLMHKPTRKCVVRYEGLKDMAWIYTMNQFINDVEQGKLEKYDTR